jgi:hypothetical protein
VSGSDLGPGPRRPGGTGAVRRTGRRRIGSVASYWGGALRTGVVAWVGMTFDVGGG